MNQHTESVSYLYDAGAMALDAGMPDEYFHAGRLKYGMNKSIERDLVLYLMSAVADIAVKERWRGRKGTIEELCSLAAMELSQPGIFRDLGKSDISQFRLMFIETAGINISERSWSSLWSKRYEAVYALLNGWADNAYRWAIRSHKDGCDEC